MPNRYSLDALEERQATVLANLDPRLQCLAVQWREAENLAFGFHPVAPVPDIPVIARVTNIRAWELIRAIARVSRFPDRARRSTISSREGSPQRRSRP